MDEKAVWFEKEIFPWFYLNRKMIAARGLSEVAVANALADWLRKQPWALAAYTREQLNGTLPSTDGLGRMMQASFRDERSGDVAVITKPHYLVYATKTGTGHNSPHEYDTHVPLMVIGAGLEDWSNRSAGHASGDRGDLVPGGRHSATGRVQCADPGDSASNTRNFAFSLPALRNRLCCDRRPCSAANPPIEHTWR